MLCLFQELGYRDIAPLRGAVDLDGKTYRLSHSWDTVPIHLVGAGVDLDRRTAGVAGAARMSPHGMMQELLNHSDQWLWGLVSNGRLLRVVRDSFSLTRSAWLEFDLQAMFEGELYADFTLLWMVCHASRVSGEPTTCYLEQWFGVASEEGTRALDGLRQGVETAIRVLGSACIGHSANGNLRKKLQGGQLGVSDYYRQLLRLVYRLLFLFVMDDRGLLLDSDASQDVKSRYAWYSSTRLRHLAGRRRGTRHADLFEGLKVLMRRLGGDSPTPALGFAPLGGFIWSDLAIPDLLDVSLRNEAFLDAVRALSYTQQGEVRRPVDYRNLGTEELGSIYESLLELTPKLDLNGSHFELRVVGGHERKTTGSYYTPATLIATLLDSNLEPLLETALRSTDPEQALLSLKICDPACGSGHFLIGAAHRIAHRLASVRTGEEEPGPRMIRAALRDVISHCIYGVDLNEMAVELCKVNLWMEALDPVRPLSFLESRIISGNSLLGTLPGMMTEGLPDEAFGALTGDDKAVAAGLRKRNREVRCGQLMLPLFEEVRDACRALEEVQDGAIEGVRERERRHQELLRSAPWKRARLIADAWCSAFTSKKLPGHPIVDEAAFRNLVERGSLTKDLEDEVRLQAANYHFLHWHLAFPDVFGRGGFDLVIGNPPWERMELQEKEFFASRSPEIASAPNSAARQKLLAQHPELEQAFLEERRRSQAETHFIRSSSRYHLAVHGGLNTYAAFLETMRSIVRPGGRVGCIVPSGLATDEHSKLFFRDLMESRDLESFYHFDNRLKLFPAVGTMITFALLSLQATPHDRETDPEFVCFAQRTEHLRDGLRRFTLTAEDFKLINPNSRTLPIFRFRSDAELTRRIYQRVPVLRTEDVSDPWKLRLGMMFQMSADSELFRTQDELEDAGGRLKGNVFLVGAERWLPLYEGKMAHQFDHRWATYNGTDTRIVAAEEKLAPVLPRYWVQSAEVEARLLGRWERPWLMGWRDICRSTDERTVIASVLPRVGVGHTFQLLFPQVGNPLLLLGNLNSLVLDYVARQKIGGIHLTYSYLYQLPILAPDAYDAETEAWLTERLLALVYTCEELGGLREDFECPIRPVPFDEMVRQHVRAELDARWFQMYGLSRMDVEYVLGTFEGLRRKEEARYDEFKTRRLVLEAFDAMSRKPPATVSIERDVVERVG
ncbi:MAG: Eco57I restriction-modification methylase domain-containing protein [Candidatus Xenobia bacterium]